MDRYTKGNLQLWEEWTDINFHSTSYDVAGFKTAGDTFDPIILEGVGDVAGKSLLHLQCHFGMNNLTWAQLGATVTGIDFSPKAIAYARQLAADMHIPATFIQTDLYDLPQVLDGQFDVIFTSWGVLEWLPDLEKWGEIIGRYLKPGGVFYIIEVHPTLMIFDDSEPKELRVKYPYFHDPEPLIFEPKQGNYADSNAVVTQTVYSWQHSLAEIINALLVGGLRLDFLREYPFVTWKVLPFLVEGEEEYGCRLPPEYPKLPLSFAIRAIKAE
jgi:SAM-dependent methyltransferase